MAIEYPIIAVTPAMVVGDEPLGTKEKFWFEYEGEQWLYKECRAISGSLLAGEDWSEKIAAEIARMIGIPAAKVELADCLGDRGCASRKFTSDTLQLMHGNEILAEHVLGYEQGRRYGQCQHTLEHIFAAIHKVFPEDGQRREVSAQFAGYCVLDALIGNVDRHHENWGVLWQVGESATMTIGTSIVNPQHQSSRYQLAPSFDHASSLGRELTDQVRERKLANRQVGAYVRRGRGGIYPLNGAQGENPLRLVESAAVCYPDYFRPGLQRLRDTQLSALQGLADGVPDDRMSLSAKKFVVELLDVTYTALTRITP